MKKTTISGPVFAICRVAVCAAVCAAAFVFASCGLKGGTIEVINDSKTDASVQIMKGITPVTGIQKADANGGKTTFTIGEDGTYTVNAVTINPAGHDSKDVTLSGGTIKTVRVKP